SSETFLAARFSYRSPDTCQAPLSHGNRISRRARRSLQAQRGEYEREFVDLVAGQFFQVQIFQVVNAVTDEQQWMDVEWTILILRRHNFGSPGVRADQDNLLVAQPARGGHAQARLSLAIGFVIHHPQLAVACAEQDRIRFANTNTLLFQCTLKVGNG